MASIYQSNVETLSMETLVKVYMNFVDQTTMINENFSKIKSFDPQIALTIKKIQNHRGLLHTVRQIRNCERLSKTLLRRFYNSLHYVIQFQSDTLNRYIQD